MLQVELSQFKRIRFEFKHSYFSTAVATPYCTGPIRKMTVEYVWNFLIMKFKLK